jgi:hypothetical protein
VVNYPPATATDNCTITNLACTPPPGSVFALGVTTVRCAAVDGSGNSNSCTFTVTVQDAEPPQIACPGNIVANTTPGQCLRRNVAYFPAATDNCPGVTVLCEPPSGSSFPPGSTTVTCTAEDAFGNSTQCSFTVTIRDVESPQIHCPPDVEADTDIGQCYRRSVPYPTPATDNCPGVTMVCDPPAGSSFPTGVTVVACLAWDAAGNSNACSFRVTIRDAEPPRMLCPGDQVADCDGPRGAEVFFAALATDNCAGSLTADCVPPSGSLFPLGAHTVFCSVNDERGNSNQCSFTITVVCPVLHVEVRESALVFSWLARWPEATLQAAPHLNPPAPWTDLWSEGASPVVVSNGVCTVSMPANDSARFYRLRL